MELITLTGIIFILQSYAKEEEYTTYIHLPVFYVYTYTYIWEVIYS